MEPYLQMTAPEGNSGVGASSSSDIGASDRGGNLCYPHPMAAGAVHGLAGYNILVGASCC